MNLAGVDMRDAFFDGVYDVAARDAQVIFLTADHTAFGLVKFARDLPKQYMNVGIAEQNMASLAAGLALSGKTVFIYSIVSFVTFRCFEQINIDICSMNLPINIVSMGTGLTYCSDGPTHHGIQDQAVMATLPNITIWNASDAVNSRAFAEMAYRQGGPKLIRIEKGKLPLLYAHGTPDFSAGFAVLKEGTDAVIVATGVMVHRAMEATRDLEKRSIHASVIDLYRIKPIHAHLLLPVLRKAKKVITLEENVKTGGMGSMLASLMMENGIHCPFKRMAIEDQYCFESGPRDWMQNHYGLGREKVVQAVVGEG